MTIYHDTLNADVSCSQDAWTNGPSVDLPAGRFFVTGIAQMTTSSVIGDPDFDVFGRTFSTRIWDGTTGYCQRTRTTRANGHTYGSSAAILDLASPTTIYLQAQISGGPFVPGGGIMVKSGAPGYFGVPGTLPAENAGVEQTHIVAIPIASDAVVASQVVTTDTPLGDFGSPTDLALVTLSEVGQWYIWGSGQGYQGAISNLPSNFAQMFRDGTYYSHFSDDDPIAHTLGFVFFQAGYVGWSISRRLQIEIDEEESHEIAVAMMAGQNSTAPYSLDAAILAFQAQSVVEGTIDASVILDPDEWSDGPSVELDEGEWLITATSHTHNIDPPSLGRVLSYAGLHDGTDFLAITADAFENSEDPYATSTNVLTAVTVPEGETKTITLKARTLDGGFVQEPLDPDDPSTYGCWEDRCIDGFVWVTVNPPPFDPGSCDGIPGTGDPIPDHLPDDPTYPQFASHITAVKAADVLNYPRIDRREDDGSVTWTKSSLP